jgi:hypothetical protein
MSLLQYLGFPVISVISEKNDDKERKRVEETHSAVRVDTYLSASGSGVRARRTWQIEIEGDTLGG